MIKVVSFLLSIMFFSFVIAKEKPKEILGVNMGENKSNLKNAKEITKDHSSYMFLRSLTNKVEASNKVKFYYLKPIPDAAKSEGFEDVFIITIPNKDDEVIWGVIGFKLLNTMKECENFLGKERKRIKSLYGTTDKTDRIEAGLGIQEGFYYTDLNVDAVILCSTLPVIKTHKAIYARVILDYQKYNNVIFSNW
ncbi:hypothetical protein [Persephonella sp.]